MYKTLRNIIAFSINCKKFSLNAAFIINAIW